MTFQKSNLGALDRGHRPDEPKPCCYRMIATVDGQPVSTWCVLVDGHTGPHESPVPRAVECNSFGPEDAIKRRWGR